jgi:RimJ/RimL family protein N-acetyltransferase
MSNVTTPVPRTVHDTMAMPGSTLEDVVDAGSVFHLDPVRLKDGTQIRIRLLELADRKGLTDLYSRLGEHSRYQRFFACPARLPTSWADALLDLAPERRLSLVAEPLGEPGRIVALADYTVSPDRDCAEIGLLVEDAWQQRGLGRVLFEQLIALGESRGVLVFVAFVHWSNLRTIQVLPRLTTVLDRRMEAGILRFTFTRSREA